MRANCISHFFQTSLRDGCLLAEGLEYDLLEISIIRIAAGASGMLHAELILQSPVLHLFQSILAGLAHQVYSLFHNRGVLFFRTAC